MASPACRILLIGTVFVSLGSLSAQTNPAVETSRLFERSAPPTGGMVTPDGMALPEGESATSEDGSFGAQQILKTQEKIPDFTLGGSLSGFYTNNVALTRSHTISDSFLVGAAFFNWTPRINPTLQFQFGTGVSFFRYWDTAALDFENIGTGAGLLWTPPNFWGIGILGRYDFAELLDPGSNEILQDHEFSVTVQKLLVLGRSHSLTLGVIGSAGISDPFAEQRDQAGFAVGYHLQVTRQLGTDLGYRLSGYFYNKGGRDDLNQVFSLGLHYYITPWASVDSFLTGALNHSNEPAFRYNVLSTGGGIGVTAHF